MRIALDTIAIMFSCAINSKFCFIVLVIVRGYYPYAKRTERWQKYDSHNFRIDKRGDVPRISAVLAIFIVITISTNPSTLQRRSYEGFCKHTNNLFRFYRLIHCLEVTNLLLSWNK